MPDDSVNPTTLAYARKLTKSPRNWRRRLIVGGVSLLVLGGVGLGGWYWWSSAVEQRQEARAQELAKQASETRDRQVLRDAVDRGEITREQARRAGREERMKQFEQTAREFFALPKEQQVAFLDQRIDQFLERRKEWEQRRQQEQQRPEGERRERRPEGDRERDGRSREARRMSRMDNMDPARRNLLAEFYAALRKRAEDRGIELRRPGGGNRGGGNNSGGDNNRRTPQTASIT